MSEQRRAVTASGEAAEGDGVTAPPGARDTVPAAEAPEAPEVRFPVDVPGFRGSLEQLVSVAQRGDLDLAAIPVSRITSAYRQRALEADLDPRELADFLALASRLLVLKANRLLPDGALDVDEPAGDDASGTDDPGARLAEYRLFRAAAEALLAEASQQGALSFLGRVCPEVVPCERLAIAPERLLNAFRAVLQRLPESDTLDLPTAVVSVEEKAAELRELIWGRGTLRFEEVFAAARSRLEAVAGFLALLELVKRGEARVDQEGSFGEITVTAVVPRQDG
jgi:segregation and condensation protein A